MSSCVDEIFFFQKKLNKYARLNEADKVLYYIHKLNHLNVTVSHLEETGVGKTVNALRHQGGKVGEKARGLVNKWKEMVTAEEEEEEEEDAVENEEEPQERAEVPTEAKGGGKEARYSQEEEEDEYEEDEEENCLQIEENETAADDEFPEHEDPPEDDPEPQAAPPNIYSSYGYARHTNSDSDPDDSGQYNPLTSQSDYQSHMAIPTTEYHPTSGILTPRDDSSPEWGAPSPEPAKDWRNGSSAKKSGREEKNSREEKDHGREKDKRSKGKGRHKDRDRSGSHEREKKKDKHRDKHRERDERKEEKQEEEPEEERKPKSHKDKHRERDKQHHHHGRSKEGKHRDEGKVVNGFNTPDHKDRPGKREKETERGTEERQRERVEDREESASRDSGHKESRAAERTKDSGKERHRESGKKEKHKREHRDKEESPGRHRKEKKNKHHVTEDDSSNVSAASVNKEEPTRAAERSEKEGKAKHREEKRKHKENSGKKDKHKRDVSSSREQEEPESSGDRSKKDKKSSKQNAEMDSGFGAALMGLDSPVKKKKKKKKKEVEKERESCSEDEQPSTSSGHKRGLSGDGGGLPDNKKLKLLNTAKDRLPALPDMMDEKPLLPEITPHYKPLPRVPVREEHPESGLAKMTEEEALNFVFQSKYNRRSKVYSGKVSGLAYVPSLYEICIRVLQENIDAMEFTGGVPFDILRPVLERASPKQLLNLEEFNPYLLEDSGLLWEVHCRRDFKKESREEMETWREMWLRCSDERNRKLRNLTHNLTEKFLTKAEPKRTTKIAYIDGPAKVPKGVARAQAKYGTAAASALAAKPGKANEVAARKTAMQNVQRAERAANPRPTAAKKKKVAPLMAKTRQFFKKAFRR